MEKPREAYLGVLSLHTFTASVSWQKFNSLKLAAASWHLKIGPNWVCHLSLASFQGMYRTSWRSPIGFFGLPLGVFLAPRQKGEMRSLVSSPSTGHGDMMPDVIWHDMLRMADVMHWCRCWELCLIELSVEKSLICYIFRRCKVSKLKIISKYNKRRKSSKGMCWIVKLWASLRILDNFRIHFGRTFKKLLCGFLCHRWDHLGFGGIGLLPACPSHLPKWTLSCKSEQGLFATKGVSKNNPLPETNSEIALENGWLEDNFFPFGAWPIFRGQTVSLLGVEFKGGFGYWWWKYSETRNVLAPLHWFSENERGNISTLTHQVFWYSIPFHLFRVYPQKKIFNIDTQKDAMFERRFVYLCIKF